ncbi:MAG: hypothetical protein JRC87_02960 [Deltaproteobacteria bacterium]|nr:hypothetical protein [Deltaproteobacteria bacterium]
MGVILLKGLEDLSLEFPDLLRNARGRGENSIRFRPRPGFHGKIYHTPRFRRKYLIY